MKSRSSQWTEDKGSWLDNRKAGCGLGGDGESWNEGKGVGGRKGSGVMKMVEVKRNWNKIYFAKWPRKGASWGRRGGEG